MAARILPRLQSLLLGAAASCFLAGAGVTVADVAARGLFGANVPAAIEVTSFLIGFGALLSMPVCYERRSHVCARLLSEVNPDRFLRPLGMLGAVASVLFAGLMVWILLANTLGKIESPETTRDLGLPMVALLWIVTGTLVLALLGAIVGLWRQFSGRES
ncbi:TRAP transporter small permease [Neotabrizicola sp. VNH66]|uniref:TRAP transporter small permease n=1 Tax=Neotabrizicola sp. VNH66 TaxID=3400918 RepID=UPI003C0FAAAE